MLEHWEKTRQVALDILKPSQKELEHGLELHRNSYVFDAYGFMPAGGGHDVNLDRLIEANASRDEIRDAREEFAKDSSFNSPEQVELLKAGWEFAGVDCIFQNSGVEGNDVERMLKRLSFYTHLIDRFPDIFERAAFPDRLQAIRAHGHRALYLTTNGVPIPRKLDSKEEALGQIGVFFRLGVRMMHLTYNRRNLIGDGCAESADAGLSDFGRAVIAEMNRLGVIPDVAHSGQRTSLEAALCSRRPVVASHMVAGNLSTHYRGKRDEVIEAICRTGGYVGICGIPSFLQGTSDIRSMMDHIEYVARKFGAEHVAIGTDRSSYLAPAVTDRPAPPSRAIWESFWAPAKGDDAVITQEQYDSISWSNWPLFTVGLVQRGFSDDDNRKIIGGNVLRVIAETLA
ncbi:MAG: membrane dipeptidase [Victivallales bacterium]|nr:membrane dipeptidase [Victivallales bacterium]